MVPQRIIVAASLALCTAAFGQDIERALRIICPDGKVSHSRSCPAATGFADVPPWELHRAIMGHFTSTVAQNLLLSGRGCEPHSLYFGGAFILDFGPPKPRLLKYDPALIAEHCRRLLFKDGRNFLVCRDEDWGQGVHWSFVYQVAFDEGGSAHTTPIFEVEDSTNACEEEVTYSTIKAISYPDLNHDGFPDISITATLGTGQLTKAERLACPGGRQVFSGVANEHRPDFLFDGNRFVVAPSSQATFRLFPEPTMPER